MTIDSGFGLGLLKSESGRLLVSTAPARAERTATNWSDCRPYPALSMAPSE
jgi:hypothetical protein